MECEQNRPTIELSELFDALAHERRRFILYHLHHSPTKTIEFVELTKEVADWEAEDGIPLAQDALEDVSVSLKHIHLPKLDESGLVDYDERTETVRYREETEVDAFLELACEKESA